MNAHREWQDTQFARQPLKTFRMALVSAPIPCFLHDWRACNRMTTGQHRQFLPVSFGSKCRIVLPPSSCFIIKPPVNMTFRVVHSRRLVVC